MQSKVLIIDDDMDMCFLLQKFLKRNGYEADVAHSAAKGLDLFSKESYDVVLCDYRLGDKEGREVLQEVKRNSPHVIFLMITGYSDIKTAVDVIKMGAYDYISKPLIPDEVLNVLKTALNQPQTNQPVLRTAPLPVKKTASQKQITLNNEYLVGEAGTTKDLYQQIEIVAPTNYSIILYGESGTGKEVIAKTIHSLSKRRDKPFVAVDCGTLSKELAGSELFGHVKGAFTGALADKEGYFEMANGGTLFLDEVANLGVDVQASLLRVIQERKFKRVGGNKEIPVDIRVIVASNENLQDAYRSGKFREDLYHRFNEFSINLPALRHRKRDIPLFADFFLQKANEELGRDIEEFDDDILEMFINYPWPGNLREFRNVVRRAVLLTTAGKINSTSLPWEITQQQNIAFEPSQELKSQPYQPQSVQAPQAVTIGGPADLKSAATRAEYETIMQVLKEVNFNKTKAAEKLNIDRKTLYNKMKAFKNVTD